MSLSGLLAALRPDPGVAAVLDAARAGGISTLDVVAPAGVRPVVVAGMAHPDGADRPVLLVTATGRESEDLASALRCYLPEHAVAEFPAWETLPHERLSPRSDTVGRRLAVLRRLAHPDEAGDGGWSGRVRVLVAPIRAVMQPLVAGLGELRPVRLRQGDDIGLEETVEALVGAAYTRTDMVERRGEFAVRGGILDVFPPTEDHPLRVEFWGDTVEEVRWFSVADQRSLEVAEQGLWAPPCREILLTDAVRARAAALVDRLPGVADMLLKISEGIAVEGMESLAPALVDRMEPLLDLLPAGTHVVVVDPEKVRTRSHDLVATSDEFLAASWANASAGNELPVDLSQVDDGAVDLSTSSYWPIARVRAHALAAGIPWWSLTSLTADAETSDAEVATIGAREVAGYRGETEKALADLRDLVSAGWRVVATTEGPGPAKRMVEVLAAADVPARLAASVDEPPQPSVVHVTTAGVEHGFIAEGLRVALLTEADIAGSRSATKDMRRLPSRRRAVVDPLQLRAGDFVVHEQHGVGRYVEMVQRTIGGATREYLVIEYAPSKRGQPGDRLFVPSDSLDQVTRYVGGEAPQLSRMGGADWAKTKGRARKAVRQIAGELIRLYSARMASTGYAFGPDTPWQRELEDAFPYVETPDQLACIDEVKADMEKPIPMDRLVCGDVGYGKTEIAVRAAFKAVQDGKQVAVLVPTTLLVQQHMETFGRAVPELPGDGEAAVAVPVRRRGRGDARGPARRQRRRRHRHAPAAVGRGAVQGPRAHRRRRGAALRRRAQGEAQADAHERRRPRDVGDADPAHPRDGGHRHPRDVDAGDAARGAAPGAHVRRPLRGEADRRRDPARAAARGPGLLHPQQGRVDRARRGAARASSSPRPGSPPRTARWASTGSSRSSSTSGRSGSTCSSARRSSRPGWTSPTPTRSCSSGRTCSACPSCTSCAAGSAAAASAPTPTSCTRRSGR